jgi:methionyl-tRNA formyltransferase
LTKEDGRINWQKEAQELERQIWAFQPWPTSYTHLGEKRVKIHKAKPSNTVPGSSCVPGTVLSIGKEGIEVCCGKRSVLLIQDLQPQGKRPMSAYAFSLGAHIKPEDVFG